MGEAKRRKLLDPTWGKGRLDDGYGKSSKLTKVEEKHQEEKSGDGCGKLPNLTFIDEKHPDYEIACSIQKAFYERFNNVFLVRLDFSDNTYLIGAVHVYCPEGQGLNLHTHATWRGTKPTKNGVLELPRPISQKICQKVMDGIREAEAVIIG